MPNKTFRRARLRSPVPLLPLPVPHVPASEPKPRSNHLTARRAPAPRPCPALPPPRSFERAAEVTAPLSLPEGTTAAAALDRVLRLPSVCSKRFLTTKVDRSVTGLIAQQQCCGPLQLPVSDVAVMAQTHFGLTGSATAIGEQPIKARDAGRLAGLVCAGLVISGQSAAAWGNAGPVQDSCTLPEASCMLRNRCRPPPTTHTHTHPSITAGPDRPPGHGAPGAGRGADQPRVCARHRAARRQGLGCAGVRSSRARSSPCTAPLPRAPGPSPSTKLHHHFLIQPSSAHPTPSAAHNSQLDVRGQDGQRGRGHVRRRGGAARRDAGAGGGGGRRQGLALHGRRRGCAPGLGSSLAQALRLCMRAFRALPTTRPHPPSTRPSQPNQPQATRRSRRRATWWSPPTSPAPTSRRRAAAAALPPLLPPRRASLPRADGLGPANGLPVAAGSCRWPLLALLDHAFLTCCPAHPALLSRPTCSCSCSRPAGGDPRPQAPRRLAPAARGPGRWAAAPGRLRTGAGLQPGACAGLAL